METNKLNYIYIDWLPEVNEVVVSLPNGWQRTIVSMSDDDFMKCCIHYIFDSAPVVLKPDALNRFKNLLESKTQQMYDALAAPLNYVYSLVSFIKPSINE